MHKYIWNNREQISSSSGRTREHTCMITSYDGITGESAGQPALVHRPIGRFVSFVMIGAQVC